MHWIQTAWMGPEQTTGTLTTILKDKIPETQKMLHDENVPEVVERFTRLLL